MLAFNISSAAVLMALTWNDVPLQRDEASVYGSAGAVVHGLHARSEESTSWVVQTPSGWRNASYDDITSSLTSHDATAAAARHESDALLVEDALSFGDDYVDWSFDITNRGAPRGSPRRASEQPFVHGRRGAAVSFPL